MTTIRILTLSAALLLALVPHPALAQDTAKSKADTKEKSLFDGKTLEGWKPSKFTGGGTVTVKDGAIVMEKGKKVSGVTYDRGDFPRTDYEVTFEGKRIAGDDFFCTATFPVGDNYCSLVVGGWGGTVVGLSSLDFQDASQNETTTYKEFTMNQWYSFRIRVTKERIVAWIDKEKVADVELKDRNISTRIEVNASKPFGFSTWDTVGAVRGIRLQTLEAAGKPKK